jgi:hypothetical protein
MEKAKAIATVSFQIDTVTQAKLRTTIRTRLDLNEITI